MIHEVYYWFFYYVKKINLAKDPEFKAYIIFCMFSAANIAVVFRLMNMLSNDFFISTDKSSIIGKGLIISITYLIIMYFIIYRNRQKIFQKYENMLPKRRLTGKLIFVLYILLTLITLNYIA
jgi:hypothetical protein